MLQYIELQAKRITNTEVIPNIANIEQSLLICPL